ncbi:hypothetical protein [Streptomyces sp. CA-106131]|uniref:hypothetical protein n=1 Tax=Streptomyces sp. CA-106131 TaxID=3240045 RepID=UPI003D9236B0
MAEQSTVRSVTYDLLRALNLTTVFGNPGSTEQPFLQEFPEDFTGFLRGCPGLQAGEESDSCGAGQGQPDRRQGDPAPTPHGRDAAHNGQELSTVSPPR